MKPEQILVHKELEEVIEQKVILKTLIVEVTEIITVNICTAAEKIEAYPEAIQKLVWKALQYKCEIETRQSMSPASSEHYKKLMKYIEAFRQTKKLILQMCKRQNLGEIIIEGGF